MDIEKRKIWQQAAGDTNRNYVSFCLKWDVILNGPAIYGELEEPEANWNAHEIRLLEYGLTQKKITDLKRFCVDMKDRDLVVLRMGTKKAHAVGEVVGESEYHEEFNDVDGWDIAHVRRIRWLWKSIDQPKEFEVYTLKQGDTTQPLKSRIDSPEVYEWLEGLDIPEKAHNRSPVPLPRNGNDVNLDSISEYLFAKGIASSSISNLINEIGELVRIANWYRNEDKKPSEHETVTYLVMPLLRALGWTPQKMAIEWNKVDVALFSDLPREERSLCAVVEAKKMDESCLTTLHQAEYYAKNLGAERLRRIILTDGLRYGVYWRNVDENDFSLYAYLNLTRLRREYPLYECKGARDALLSMTPEWAGT